MVSRKESGTKMNVPRRVLPLISRILQRRLCQREEGYPRDRRAQRVHTWGKKSPNCDSFYREEAPRFIPSCHSGGYRYIGECFDGPFREVVFKRHGSQPVQIDSFAQGWHKTCKPFILRGSLGLENMHPTSAQDSLTMHKTPVCLL